MLKVKVNFEMVTENETYDSDMVLDIPSYNVRTHGDIYKLSHEYLSTLVISPINIYDITIL